MIRRKRDENDEKLFFFSLRELFSQILSRILAKIVYILRMKERFYHRFLKKKKKFYQSFIKKKKKKPSRRGNFLRNLEGEEIGWKSWRARLSLYIEGLLFSVLVGILFNSKAKTRLPTWIPFATSPFGEGGKKKKGKKINAVILEESREGIPYRGGPRFSLYRHFKKRTMKLNGAGLTKSKARQRDSFGEGFSQDKLLSSDRKNTRDPLSLSLFL